MYDIEITLGFALVAYSLDKINSHFEINPYTLIIFINLCGLYQICKNLHIDITIRYGN